MGSGFEVGAIDKRAPTPAPGETVPFTRRSNYWPVLIGHLVGDETVQGHIESPPDLVTALTNAREAALEQLALAICTAAGLGNYERDAIRPHLVHKLPCLLADARLKFVESFEREVWQRYIDTYPD